MKITEQGVALIKEFEGFRSKAYRDAVGTWTIGFGHTSMAGLPVVQDGMIISRTEAETILRADIETFSDAVRKLLKVELSDQQFSAIVSFAYNVGPGNFSRSSVLKAINAGDFEAVPRRLQLWTRAGGRILPGLVRRRAAEAALFLSDNRDVVDLHPTPPKGKPPFRSKTIVGALLALVFSFAQAWLSMSLKFASVLLLVLVAVSLGLVIFERLKKLKEEAL